MSNDESLPGGSRAFGAEPRYFPAAPVRHQAPIRTAKPHAYHFRAAIGHGLPPPPRGYQVGYYQGYSVVYDPVTYTILSLPDLLSR